MAAKKETEPLISGIIAGNPYIHAQLLNALQRAPPSVTYLLSSVLIYLMVNVPHSLAELMHSEAFALTELETDFFHATSGLISALRSYGSVLARAPSKHLRKKYERIFADIEELNRLYTEWMTEIERVSEGKYPSRLHELSAEEVLLVKMAVGKSTLAFVHKWQKVLVRLDKKIKPPKKNELDIPQLSDRYNAGKLTRADYAQAVVRERVFRIHQFVSSFLRIEKSKFNLHSVANVNRVVQDIIGITLFSRTRPRARGGQRNIVLHARIPQNAEVPLHPHVLRSMLTAAVTNSMKAMAGHHAGFDARSGKVSIEYKPTRSRHVITVRDTGPGIPKADRQRVWRWGVSKEGTAGVGLPLARSMAQAAGGRVYLRSRTTGPKHTRGTTFVLSLPRKPKHSRVR